MADKYDPKRKGREHPWPSQSPAPAKLKTLDHLDIIPFGKYYKTRTKMQDVPASYFHFLWINGLQKHELKQNTPQGAVARYIQANIKHLMDEHKDGIWT